MRGGTNDRSGRPLEGRWVEPEARGLRLGSDEAGAAQRRILRSKPSLRKAYEDVYRLMLQAAEEHVSAGGLRVELGSGGGFFDELDPSTLTSDIRPIPGVKLAFDARTMPFRDASVGVVFAMHVLHHVPEPRRFLAELQRVLRPGGALVAVEPYWSPLARVLYRYAHPEPFDTAAPAWEFESSGPMSSNQALSYLMLERDGDVLSLEFPGLEVIRLPAFGGPSYVLTGGIWRRPLLPTPWVMRLWAAEQRTRWWRGSLALHHLFLLRRRQTERG